MKNIISLERSVYITESVMSKKDFSPKVNCNAKSLQNNSHF